MIIKIYKNLGIKLFIHDSYFIVEDLTNRMNSKTWAVYDKLYWVKKLEEWEQTKVLDYESFLLEIRK